MPFYTLVLDYQGGTYVSQVNASSPNKAFQIGLESLDLSQIHGLGAATQKKLVNQVREYPPVPLDGLKNVWCATASVRGTLALMNLVQTQIESL